VDVFLSTILIGLASGSVYALAATGLVLTYKTTRVLNLGYGAIAVFTTFIYWQFSVEYRWPLWLSAAIVVLVIAPAIGFFLDSQLFRRIEDQPIVIGLMATVGIIVLLQGVIFKIWGSTTRSVPPLFPQGTVKIPGGATLGVDQLMVIGVAVGAAGLLALMLRYTRLGIGFRAVVDNRPVAGLMALNTNFISGLAWALGTSIAALTGILIVPRLLLDPIIVPFFIISFILASAMVGYLQSLPLAFAGGLLLGVIESLIAQYGPTSGSGRSLGKATPFIMVTALLLAAPRRLRLLATGGSFVVKTRELAEHASRNVRLGVAAVFFALLALIPAMVESISWNRSLATGMIQSVVFLSLVILTGFSGQISLGTTAFMGAAAFTAAHIATDLGWSSWMAFLLGSLAAVPAGALIGVIAVRLQGLYLAMLTLAFAFMAQELFFYNPSISGREGSVPLPRPSGFQSDVKFYYLALIVLVVSVVVAANLRSGRTGRVLAAIRDSETATRSLGISVTKYKVLIFSLSAFMCAAAGILASMQKGAAARLDFIPYLSMIYLTIAIVGGLFHIGGAVAAGLFFGLFQQVFAGHPAILDLQLIFFGLGATVALAKNPEGMFGEMRRGGNAVLRAFGNGKRRRPEPVPVAGGQE
jgi:branched-chain amino acid transport system permease protein